MDFLIPRGNGVFCHEKAGLALLPENNRASKHLGSHWSCLDEITERCYQHLKQRDRHKGNGALFSCKSYFTVLPPPEICEGSIKQSLNRPEASREKADAPCN